MKSQFIERELENGDMLAVIVPVDDEFAVYVFMWDTDSRKLYKHEFPPTDWDDAKEIVARYVGADIHQLKEPPCEE